MLSPERRGLIVAGAGGGDPSAVLGLSAALGWPLLADPRSGLRRQEPTVIAAADGILRSEQFARTHAPEVVLALGGRWVSKVVNGFLSASVEGGARSIVVDPDGRWPDPDRHAEAFVRCDPSLFCTEAAECLAGSRPVGPGPVGSGWARDWQEAEARAQRAIDDVLGPPAGLSEPALARRLLGHLPDGATLVVSSSMPVRDVEAFAAPRREPARVLANRGANGIDGVVSTALGVALGTRAPTVLLVGDLAFFHDVSALVGADGFTAPLTVVVADNGGGGIFSFLETARALDPGPFDTLFGTPQSPDPAAVAAACGWPVDDIGADARGPVFEDALDRRLDAGGLSVIRVRLPGRSENVAVHQRINQAVADAVEGRPGGIGGR